MVNQDDAYFSSKDARHSFQKLYSSDNHKHHKKEVVMQTKRYSIYCLSLLVTALCSGQGDGYLNEALRGRIQGLALKIKPHEIEEKGILPYGYAQLSNAWDSREMYTGAETLGSFLPKPKRFDRFGNDKNAHPLFHMTATQSTIGIIARGPSFDSIKTLGIIETDFRGGSNRSIGMLRLRHAFGFLDWQQGSFLFGQFWHPLEIPECWPNVVAFNGGAPFETFARDPQVRVVQRFSNIEFIGALASQRDFASNGPDGETPKYIRNAVVPNIHAQLRAYGESYFAGFAFDFKRLKPRLVSDKKIDVHEHIDSFITEAFLRLNYESLILRMKGIWAQNANDQGLISGFAVRTVDPITDARTYANTTAASFWFDASHFFDVEKVHEIGVFFGYSQNLGAQHKLFIDPKTGKPIIYALLGVSQNVDNLFRISPRYIFDKEPFLIGLELEYTQTAWGRPNNYGKVINTKNVGALRFLVQLNYLF
jgi:hypothetical protein